jgi:hypothetical protein
MVSWWVSEWVFFIVKVCSHLTYGTCYITSQDILCVVKFSPFLCLSVVMLCSWGGLIIKRLYQFYSHDVPCWAYVLGLAVLNLQGYWNSMIFLAVRLTYCNYVVLSNSVCIWVIYHVCGVICVEQCCVAVMVSYPGMESTRPFTWLASASAKLLCSPIS